MASAGYQYFADLPILRWSSNGGAVSFIQIDSTAIANTDGGAKPCHQGWIRVADNSQLSLILSALDQGRILNNLTVKDNSTQFTLPPTTNNTTKCVIEYIEFEMD